MGAIKNKDLNLAKLRYDFKIGKDGCSIKPILEPAATSNKRAMKHYHKRTAEVTIGEFSFNADESSINYMSSVLAIANNKVLLLAITDDFTLETAYETVFAQTVSWKDAGNEWRDIPISSLSTGLEAAMRIVASLAE